MIRRDSAGGILTVTLDRPDKANALTAEMLDTLADIFETADDNVIILTGTGRVFSAGADLDAARAGLAVNPVWERLSAAVAQYAGLTIAALNGTAAGGALGMVLACDLRIAVPSAKFFYPVMRLGFLPQPSDPPRMVALMGPSRTKYILMGGQKIDAATALDWGLVDALATEDTLFDRAKALAADATAAQRDHVKNIKSLI